MDKNVELPYRQGIFKYRFLYLLVFILMLIAIQSLDEAIGLFGVVLDLVTTAILVSAIYAISQKRIHINPVLCSRLLSANFISSSQLPGWWVHIYHSQWGRNPIATEREIKIERYPY